MNLYLYITTLFLLLLFLMMYYELASLNWEESERRLMEREELELAHILRLIDAPDVIYLMKNRKARQGLFLSFSKGLKRDVLSILRRRNVAPVSISIALFFLISYLVFRLKAQVFCGEKDLRFLSGLELVLYRSLS